MRMTESNFAFMREAIELSKKGYPAPNPRVGAIVVRDGEVIGRGYHESFGCDHAEVVALKDAGDRARGGWMFVTLEPCDHHGKTPPCTEVIINAGIERLVYAVQDPNPEAAGGANRLRAKGVIVDGGLLADEAANVNRVFLSRFRLGRPFVLAKAAITMDGRIATRDGESRWITGEEARKRAHELRAEMGCVLVGANTVIQDDPSLDVRHLKTAHPPIRVILDPDGVTPAGSRVFKESPERTLWVTNSDEIRHVETFRPHRVDGEVGLGEVLAELAKRGMIGVLVEGGGRTLEPFFRFGLVDEVELHMAPKLLGAGRAWLEGRGVEALAEAWRLQDVGIEPIGEDFKITAKVIP